MPLTTKSLRYLGQLVLVTPCYGWGWGHADAEAPPLTYEEMGGPPPFHARIAGFNRGCEPITAYRPGAQPDGAMAVIAEPAIRTTVVSWNSVPGMSASGLREAHRLPQRHHRIGARPGPTGIDESAGALWICDYPR